MSSFPGILRALDFGKQLTSTHNTCLEFSVPCVMQCRQDVTFKNTILKCLRFIVVYYDAFLKIFFFKRSFTIFYQLTTRKLW